MFASPSGFQLLLSVLLGGSAVVDRREDSQESSPGNGGFVRLSSIGFPPRREDFGADSPRTFGSGLPTQMVVLRSGMDGGDPGSMRHSFLRGGGERYAPSGDYWGVANNPGAESEGGVMPDLFFPRLFGFRIPNSFGSGRDFQTEIENILMPSAILAALQEATQTHPAFPPLENKEKKSLEYQSLSSELASQLEECGVSECTVCQERFKDIWGECEDYNACPSLTSVEDVLPKTSKPTQDPSTPSDDEAEEKPAPPKYHRRHDVFVCRLPCNHFFCKECLLKWMAYTSTCPNCRLRLQDLAEKYGDTTGAAPPSWWKGASEPPEVEEVNEDDDDVEEEREPVIHTEMSPVPVPAFAPQPPSSERPGAHPRFRFRTEGASDAAAASSLARVGSSSIVTAEGSDLSSRVAEGPSARENNGELGSSRFTPSAVSPHRTRVTSDEEDTVFDNLPQGAGATAVRRLRRSRREPTQERLSGSRQSEAWGRPPIRRLPRGNVNSSNNAENSLFPRIQLGSRQPGSNRMRVVPLPSTSPTRRGSNRGTTNPDSPANQ